MRVASISSLEETCPDRMNLIAASACCSSRILPKPGTKWRQKCSSSWDEKMDSIGCFPPSSRWNSSKALHHGVRCNSTRRPLATPEVRRHRAPRVLCCVVCLHTVWGVPRRS